MATESRPNRENVERRLRVRLRLYTLIFVAMLAVVIIEGVRGRVSPILIVAGTLGGVTIGLVVSRMYDLHWDEETNKVVSRLDWLGGVILVLYLAFSLSRDWLFGHWVQGPSLGVLTLSLTAGTMAGRVLGTVEGIRRTMRAWGLPLA